MKKLIFAFVILSIISVLIYQYVFHDKRDIKTETASFKITYNTLEKDFLAGEDAFNKKYLDKTIELQGKITEIDTVSNSILIDDKIFANFKDKFTSKLKLNQALTIKARLVGYDDLLECFKLDQASIVN